MIRGSRPAGLAIGVTRFCFCCGGGGCAAAWAPAAGPEEGRGRGLCVVDAGCTTGVPVPVPVPGEMLVFGAVTIACCPGDGAGWPGSGDWLGGWPPTGPGVLTGCCITPPIIPADILRTTNLCLAMMLHQMQVCLKNQGYTNRKLERLWKEIFWFLYWVKLQKTSASVATSNHNQNDTPPYTQSKCHPQHYLQRWWQTLNIRQNSFCAMRSSLQPLLSLNLLISNDRTRNVTNKVFNKQ